MNFTQVIDRACQEPTLEDALSFVALWECERIIPIANTSLVNGNISRNPDGTGWSTCFKFLIKEVLAQYGQQQTLKVLKG